MQLKAFVAASVATAAMSLAGDAIAVTTYHPQGAGYKQYGEYSMYCMQYADTYNDPYSYQQVQYDTYCDAAIDPYCTSSGPQCVMWGYYQSVPDRIMNAVAGDIIFTWYDSPLSELHKILFRKPDMQSPPVHTIVCAGDWAGGCHRTNQNDAAVDPENFLEKNCSGGIKDGGAYKMLALDPGTIDSNPNVRKASWGDVYRYSVMRADAGSQSEAVNSLWWGYGWNLAHAGGKYNVSGFSTRKVGSQCSQFAGDAVNLASWQGSQSFYLDRYAQHDIMAAMASMFYPMLLDKIQNSTGFFKDLWCGSDSWAMKSIKATAQTLNAFIDHPELQTQTSWNFPADSWFFGGVNGVTATGDVYYRMGGR